jgi:murein DD-endopeptidase MepM/ murein hydrolase activator NlpD
MSAGRRIRPGLVVAIISALTMLCCGGGAASLFFENSKDAYDATYAIGCGSDKKVDPNGKLPSNRSLNTEQVRNAAIIIQVGQEMQISPKGWIIAIATALQESWLRNLPNLGEKNDHDSVGLFQQRPSQGWGTVEEITNPHYSSKKFYEKLLLVKGWQNMTLTDAAQKVQRSAFPNAYAKHEPLASSVVNTLTGGAARAAVGQTQLKCISAGEISASGWTVPLRGKIVSGFRTPSRPTHHGVDIAAVRGTVIHAASAGTVIKSRCNAIGPNGSDWGCDRDGSPQVRGCGWYVDILHAQGIVTRYCHMVKRPFVAVGQQVTAGQQIGISGTSGNSSGPHLHFETHMNGDSSKNGAIEPLRFMQDVGAPLGAES